jgi:hypothetical protein
MGFDPTPPYELTVTPGDGAGARLPWWAKIAAKLVLSRVVPGYAWRRRLGIGVHSFASHTLGHPAEIAREVAWFAALNGRPPASLLELGPGDSLANALYARALGVGRIWLMDTSDHAVAGMDAYRRIAGGLPGLPALDFSSRAAMLAGLGATYLTGGPASLAEIPDGAMELCVSYMVLEHVRRADFATLLAELHRLAAPGGLGHHFVDLMDHLGGGLNNLRFPSWLWEREAIARAGFYTNRLGRPEIVALAEAAGFETAIAHVSRWPALPLPRRAMAAEFRARPEDELGIASFTLRLRRPPA